MRCAIYLHCNCNVHQSNLRPMTCSRIWRILFQSLTENYTGVMATYMFRTKSSPSIERGFDARVGFIHHCTGFSGC